MHIGNSENCCVLICKTNRLDGTEPNTMTIKNAFIATCLVLIFITVGTLLYRQNVLQANFAMVTPSKNSKKIPEKVHSVTSNPKKSAITNSNTPNEFYQLIIDNNIFRPLGWKPPKKTPQYTLIGTTIASDSSNAKAFILERRSNQLHTVKVGETIDNVTIKEILPKQVTLKEKEKDIILKCGTLQFLR